jgi:hypothetical protein
LIKTTDIFQHHCKWNKKFSTQRKGAKIEATLKYCLVEGILSEEEIIDHECGIKSKKIEFFQKTKSTIIDDYLWLYWILRSKLPPDIVKYLLGKKIWFLLPRKDFVYVYETLLELLIPKKLNK